MEVWLGSMRMAELRGLTSEHQSSGMVITAPSVQVVLMADRRLPVTVVTVYQYKSQPDKLCQSTGYKFGSVLHQTDLLP